MGKWRVWLGLCNSVWFGISGKLRNMEGWWDQVPLDRCLIETDAPYLGGGGRIGFLVRILGVRGRRDFIPRKMVGAILTLNFRDFCGVA